MVLFKKMGAVFEDPARTVELLEFTYFAAGLEVGEALPLDVTLEEFIPAIGRPKQLGQIVEVEVMKTVERELVTCVDTCPLEVTVFVMGQLVTVVRTLRKMLANASVVYTHGLTFRS